MKKQQLKELQVLGKEHSKLKASILEMCDALDKTKDIGDKEAIKIAIDKSIVRLTEIEDTYQAILDTIPLIGDARD